MKILCKVGLGVSLCLLVSAASAQDVEWRATSAPLPTGVITVSTANAGVADAVGKANGPVIVVIPDRGGQPGAGATPYMVQSPSMGQYSVELLKNPEFIRMVTNAAAKRDDHRTPAPNASRQWSETVKQPQPRGRQQSPDGIVVVPVMISQGPGLSRVQYMELPKPGEAQGAIPVSALKVYDTPPPPVFGTAIETDRPGSGTGSGSSSANGSGSGTGVMPSPRPYLEKGGPIPSPTPLDDNPAGSGTPIMISDGQWGYGPIGEGPGSGWHGHGCRLCDDLRNWSNCDCGCPSEMFYADAQYLLWWMNGSHTPALATTGSSADLVPGALGQHGTSTIIGDDSLPNSSFSGMRLTAGYWFDCDHCWGIEGSYLFLSGRSQGQGISSAANGNPLIARPIINTSASDVEQALLVSVPGRVAGSESVTQNSDFWGAEVNLRSNWYADDCFRVDALVGFRYLSLDEGLSIDQSSASFANSTTALGLGVSLPAGSDLSIHDSFDTSNRFYGAQIGVASEYRWHRWFVDANAKLAMGVTRQNVGIDGEMEISGTKPNFLKGGLLTSPTGNIGNHDQDTFSIVPEIGINVGVNITDYLRAYVGYNLIYWSDVVRPGDQVDRHVNATQLPLNSSPATGPAAPAFSWHTTDFWAQGVNFGVEFRY